MMQEHGRVTVSSLSHATVQQRPQTNLIRVFTPEAPDPNAPSYNFLNTVGQFHQYKIVTVDNDPEDEALTRAVLVYHPQGYIEFRDWAFSTQQRSVASWLTKRIKQGRAHGIVPDSADIPVACHLCGHVFPGTKAGRQELAEHIFDHPVGTDVDGLPAQFRDVLPAAVPIPVAPASDDAEGEGYATAVLAALAERDAAQRELDQLRAEMNAIKEAANGRSGSDQELQRGDGRSDDGRGSGDSAEYAGDSPVRDDAGDVRPVLPSDGDGSPGGGGQHVHRAGRTGRAGRAQGRPEPATQP